MIDARAVLAHLEDLRSLNAEENGAPHATETLTWQRSREWLVAELNDLPVEQHRDDAGNHWATLPGASPRALVLGSHLGSVSSSGRLDGHLGAIAGLEVLKALAQRSGGKPPCTIKLVDWAMGQAATPEPQPAGAGEGPRRSGEADGEQEELAAYLALHVEALHGEAPPLKMLHTEQASVPERAGKPLGVGTGILGVERWTLVFTGQEPNAGSPTAGRRDALAACEQLGRELRSLAQQHPGSVAVVSFPEKDSATATAVPGHCEATVELGGTDPDLISTLLARARGGAERFAAEAGCSVAWTRLTSVKPFAFHPQLITFLEEAALELTGASERFPAAMVPDAAEVARLGIPAGMLFVQPHGTSETREEGIERLQLMQAAEAFGRAAESAMHWVANDGNNDLWAEEHRTPHLHGA